MKDGQSADLCDATSGMPDAFLSSLFHQSGDCIKFISLDGCLTYMSANGQVAMDIDDFEEIRGAFWWQMWPQQSQELVKTAVKDASSGKSAKFVAFCPTAKGVPKWWEVSVSPVRNAQGEVRSLVSVSRDITDLQLQREQLQTIALEMRHRLKNAYTVSAALAKLQARQNPELGEYAEELASRFNVLALAQSSLLQNGSQMASEVIEGVLSPYGGLVEFDLAALADAQIDESHARTLALVLGELATNSLKYGGLGSGEAVKVVASVEGGEAILTWDERQSANTAKGEGSGTELMDRMAMSIGGRIKRKTEAGRFSVSLLFPLPKTA